MWCVLRCVRVLLGLVDCGPFDNTISYLCFVAITLDARAAILSRIRVYYSIFVV